MRLPERQFQWKIGRWKLGITVCPGIWMFGLWWDGDPYSCSITLPLMCLWIERDGGKYWQWDWTIFRIVIGKQEIRTDLTLNNWGVGICVHQTADWSIHFDPIDIECEYDKFYDDDLYTKPPVLLRLFSKTRQPCECEVKHKLDASHN